MRWKTLGGRCIYHSPNGINVYQNPLYRWLTLDSNAVQTLINRRHPERPALDYIKPLTISVRAQPANCCLLGLGGGGVAHALSSCLIDYHLDVVEHNPEVIRLAKTYFMMDRLANLNVIRRDANIFMQQNQKIYNHLMVDLFDAHSFPQHCNHSHFFAHCRRLLLPHGTLAVNLANLREQWPIFQHIRTHFNQSVLSLPVKGTANMVILASCANTILPLIDLLKSSQRLKQLSWDSNWGYVADI
ncbi:spermidine synthase [Legionella nagasakiensis]|uniref:spermidine synthase n=1 Tax=Legionella nagasakiensis TaxID=535290 RepID=UPI001055527E|nr:fused MFS/spermidine synthase [Legionella nagasakiensis]